jgi:membrane protein required for colicin V production
VNYLDYILLVILGWSVITGFMAGFTRIGIGFAATVLGILFGMWFYDIPAAWVSEYLRSDTAANLLGFFVVFTLFLMTGALAGQILGKAMKTVGLSFLDRLGGAAFGFVRGAFVVVGVVTVLTAFAPQPPPRVIVESRVLPYATTAGNVLAWLAPAPVKDAYNKTMDRLRRAWAEPDPQKKLEILKGGPA